ncbi:MAG: Phenylserine dehydratase [Candidatus Accumulibacter regalis]|jgi:L-serine/L-threonine ammonia-lyase|uniref:L-serine ammonia-lyase n=1 Tax=Accumulibacter regalis TaxID=522306 RepID=A0A011QP36_ACCRE|nr:pyridoxal-phosphate dependent enzyme [Accumulibacter sp.]EXI91052.1 MAG: Phenylserine dehydratase [Candidatus Accumulibacter regalis]MQM35511.1 serine dehydratase [Candidatus Accumulibacter phosphatis]MBL8367038.1 pyridoxal-phosphate dependent enzyme [Accumulibacter sp.]MBN8513958.1 pyridoxal-phosphate dependent enzyme [Accumulibacter sp.]MBO3701754.1 pyridoxal-phosphate dependent enzyme [Accumulibacter sp.]
MPLHIETPLIESRSLSSAGHCSVWLKLEALQPPGSFKIRGIGAACEEYSRRGARRFVSSSGGNAGLAVAYAGRRLATPVTVVVPETTSARARELLRQEAAEIIVHGASWHEANVLALSMIEESDAFLHPFDDPLLWHGHATMVDELARSMPAPDAVVLSVGGGGLLCGVIEGLHRNGLGRVPVIAVETAGAASFNRSLLAGQRVELEAISSVATSLGAKRVCERAFQWSTEHPIHSVVVSDHAALDACERFLADHRLLVEPACGAGLALAYAGSPVLAGFARVAFIVCGGATATIDQIREWSANAAEEQEDL